MKKFVDYDTDIKEPFECVLKGAYNKANIWPKSKKSYGKYAALPILREELEEVEQAYIGFKKEASYFSENCYTEQRADLIGHVMSLMTELLQVVAVCNKFWPDTFRGEDHE